MIEAKNTRDKIVKLSIQLMSQKGFNNTGISEILALANVPKGSFYHYFKSKDDLGFAIIEQYGNNLVGGVEQFLSESSLPPLQRVRAYFDWAIDYFAGDFALCNCLLGNLAQELATQHPALREAVFAYYQKIEGVIANEFKAAQGDGTLSLSLDANALAKYLFSGWEGALVRAKLEQSLEPVKQYLQLFFEHTIKV